MSDMDDKLRDLLRKKYNDVYAPLKRVTESRFPSVRERFLELRKTLSNQRVPLAQRITAGRKAGAPAKKELNDLVKELKDIKRKMEGLAKINKLIKKLEELAEKEGKQEDLMKAILKWRIEQEVGGADKKPKPKPKPKG